MQVACGRSDIHTLETISAYTTLNTNSATEAMTTG